MNLKKYILMSAFLGLTSHSVALASTHQEEELGGQLFGKVESAIAFKATQFIPVSPERAVVQTTDFCGSLDDIGQKQTAILRELTEQLNVHVGSADTALRFILDQYGSSLSVSARSYIALQLPALGQNGLSELIGKLPMINTYLRLLPAGANVTFADALSWKTEELLAVVHAQSLQQQIWNAQNMLDQAATNYAYTVNSLIQVPVISGDDAANFENNNNDQEVDDDVADVVVKSLSTDESSEGDRTDTVEFVVDEVDVVEEDYSGESQVEDDADEIAVVVAGNVSVVAEATIEEETTIIETPAEVVTVEEITFVDAPTEEINRVEDLFSSMITTEDFSNL